MARFYDVGGTPLIVTKNGMVFAWDNHVWMPVPASLSKAGAELTLGGFEQSFPQVDMRHLFDKIGAGNPLALLAKAHLHLAESAENGDEVDYRMDIAEQTWTAL